MKYMRMAIVAMFLVGCSLLFSGTLAAQNQHVFFVPPGGGALQEYIFYNGIWNPEIVFGGQYVVPQNSTIASFAGGGKLYACYFNQVGPVSEVVVMSTPSNTTLDAWTTTHLSTIGAPIPDINSGLMGYVDSSGNPRIFYVQQLVNGAQPLIEIIGNAGTWSVDARAGIGRSAQAGTSLTGYLFNNNPTVWYLAVDGHVQETYQVGDTWYSVDATALSGAPNAVFHSGLTGYQFGSNATLYFIADIDDHVHQLWWNGSGWFTDDVTAIAGAPNPFLDSQLMGYMFNGQPTVFYLGGTGDLYEMWWTGSQEAFADWTALAGGQVPSERTPLTGYALNGQSTLFHLDGPFGCCSLAETFWNGSIFQNTIIGSGGVGQPSGTGLATAIF